MEQVQLLTQEMDNELNSLFVLSQEQYDQLPFETNVKDDEIMIDTRSKEERL